MKEFYITVSGTVTVVQQFTIEADNEEEARSQAMQEAQAPGGTRDWVMIGEVSDMEIDEIDTEWKGTIVG